MKEKDSRDDWDDGSVIAPMNGDELPAYRRIFGGSRRTEKRVKSDITKKERRSMMRAMFAVMFPRLLVVLIGFGLTIALIFLWLS